MDEQIYPAAHDEAARLQRENVAIEAASVEVAAGNFVALEAVEAWIDSWDTDHELPMPQPVASLQPKG